MNGNSGFLASMALFRQLYNDRSNIFQVVAYFLVDMIKDERMKSFTLPQIANLINSNYSFDIPESIYRRSLKNLTRSKILSLNDSVYNLVGDINSLKSPDID